jgi:hypothetical protein
VAIYCRRVSNCLSTGDLVVGTVRPAAVPCGPPEGTSFSRPCATPTPWARCAWRKPSSRTPAALSRIEMPVVEPRPAASCCGRWPLKCGTWRWLWAGARSTQAAMARSRGATPRPVVLLPKALFARFAVLFRHDCLCSCLRLSSLVPPEAQTFSEPCMPFYSRAWIR